MTPGGRWAIVALIIVGALIVAIWPRTESEPAETAASATRGQTAIEHPERRPADTPEALRGPRAEAQLQPCPQPQPQAPAPAARSALAALNDLDLGCLADGERVDVSRMLAGKPAVINLWAYWCGPCAKELPALQEYAASAGTAVTVITVHRDPNEANALRKLADYEVTLPGLQDGSGQVAGRLGAPNVLPVTIVLNADGSLAEILAVPFTSADEIRVAVENALGGAA
ncbi:TlpA family protein disulfide reductase [Hoyosella sp. YIM 151337]|uniref:TlpA family protein disulfide reductase n=1 Tax=Hoyosella sp. YIM 151337 TaxID=2992742 RepID=UPI00223650DA|nr:TlpA disulfide reductase family protein [Hoyosella sp. YIM 151337]MCW4352712.1 TlpA family protein disulfide reductase [Hoyosella sp. YIM 151337]